MAAGIACDVVLTVLGQVARVKRARSARQLRRAAALGMAMIALGTLASAATMFAATAVPDGRFFFDAFTAVQLGAMLVAASASAIARPAFFAFAGAGAFGGGGGRPEGGRVGGG